MNNNTRKRNKCIKLGIILGALGILSLSVIGYASYVIPDYVSFGTETNQIVISSTEYIRLTPVNHTESFNIYYDGFDDDNGGRTFDKDVCFEYIYSIDYFIDESQQELFFTLEETGLTEGILIPYVNNISYKLYTTNYQRLISEGNKVPSLANEEETKCYISYSVSDMQMAGSLTGGVLVISYDVLVSEDEYLSSFYYNMCLASNLEYKMGVAVEL